MFTARRPLNTAFSLLAGLREKRRGVFTVIASIMLVVAMGFVALSVDISMISFTKTKLQNAVDTAALAAAQEITAAIESAGASGSDAGDANAIAEAAARDMAVKVAELNGVYINGETDVQFGKRVYDADSDSFNVEWGSTPFNVVGVTARMDNPDFTAPDAELELFFAPVFGKNSQQLGASAVAFVEARDIVAVLDYSGSMTYDTQYKGVSKLGLNPVVDNLIEVADALETDLGTLHGTPEYVTFEGQPAQGPIPHVTVTFKGSEIYAVSSKELSNVVLEFTDGTHQKHDSLDQNPRYEDSFAGTGYNEGKTIKRCWIKSGQNFSDDGPGYGERFTYSYTTIKQAYGLDQISYPYAVGSWDEFIHYCQTDSDPRGVGMDHKYGKANFAQYLLDWRQLKSQTEDLWKTPHYPFHGMKNGFALFCDFLDGLEFGDHLGLVSYATTSRWEDSIYVPDEGVDIDLTDEPITNEYSSIKTIQQHHQAGHYSNTTGIGYGLENAISMLGEHKRFGARPTIFLMTDGNANQYPSGWSLPGDWDWAELTDFDGDGSADYTTGNTAKQYAFYQAREAINAGYTIHTMSVGAGADRDLMEAIAFAGHGQWINVPGGSTVAELQDQLLVAFTKIAANVPPPQLLVEHSAEN
ncbi:Tad domain-containing protein [Calycomorphotria hydatis]|uniref:von Willebrand factor type A domain protein n=1 Tax=Calycomorphotria hydatis TaxID=2528027 RepID=A0A517TCL9_9PLAN|nr:Tad domain-containing protein [Calycomorphotria hydatis]QDT66119.1 von Willebrand factor type A domain protein [Calycomorphotria hydatis]